MLHEVALRARRDHHGRQVPGVEPVGGMAAPRGDHALGTCGLVVGERAEKIAEGQADQYIAGCPVADDSPVHGRRLRTKEGLQGRISAASTPVDPVMVSPEGSDPATAALGTSVTGESMQEHPIRKSIS